VLVVEDDPDWRFTMARALGLAGRNPLERRFRFMDGFLRSCRRLRR
jgi:hypothetical protein